MNRAVIICGKILALLAGFSWPAIAGGDDRYTVKLKTGTYTVKYGEKGEGEFGEGQPCIFRAAKKFWCPETFVEFLSFGAAVRTRNSAVVPVYGGMRGSGIRTRTPFLLIEQRAKKVSVTKALMEWCHECAMRVGEVRRDRDFVNIRVGRYEGFEVRVLVDKGKVGLRRVPIDSKEPIDAKTCGYLFENLQHCGASSDRDSCPPFSMIANSTTQAMNWLRDNHPGADTKFDERCVEACRTRETPSRRVFFKQFCRR